MPMSPMMESLAHDCTLLDRKRVPDGAGGWANEWIDSAEFRLYPSLDMSIQAKVAEQQGVTSVYTCLVEKALPIVLGDYFRDNTLNATFRVTTNPDEKATPGTASFSLKAFTAEKAVPPR